MQDYLLFSLANTIALFLGPGAFTIDLILISVKTLLTSVGGSFVCVFCILRLRWRFKMSLNGFHKAKPETVDTWRRNPGNTIRRKVYRTRNYKKTLNILKGRCYEIFDLWCFSSNNSIWALIHGLKPFCKWLRGDIRLWTRRFWWSAVSMTPITTKVILS
jgi:hypothetical protein